MIGIPLILLAALSQYRCDSTECLPPAEEAAIACGASQLIDKSSLYFNLQPLPPIPPRREDKDIFAVKTNAVPLAAGIMNVECEAQLTCHLSISVPLWWSPYFIGSKHALRVFAVQPELRYWLTRAGKGHFFGLHPGIAWYNLRWKDIRYQDSGMPLINAGLSYGYSLRLSPAFNAEFTIGAGVAKTKYDRYYNIENGAKIDTRQTTYFGIDRFGISLVYHFDL